MAEIHLSRRPPRKKNQYKFPWDDTRQSFTEAQLEEYQKVFKLFDKNGDGTVTASEMATVFRALGQNPTRKQIKEMIEEVDYDGNGSLDFDEFLVLMDKRFKNVDPVQQLVSAFQVFDKDGDGFITAQEIKQVLTKLGEKCSLSEAEQMLNEADIDANGKIDIHEFSKFLMLQQQQ